MARPFARARLGVAVVVAFLGGLIVAAGFDLTPFGHAQQQDTVDRRPVQEEVKPLAEVSNAFVSIAQNITPAVVHIESVQESRGTGRARPQVPRGLEDYFQFDDEQRQRPPGTGTGFIVSADGLILTNNHVIAGADRVNVRLMDKRVFPARVIGGDPSTDIALLRIESNERFPFAQLGDDTRMRIGDWVLAVGNPLGLDFTVTAGIVSAKGRSLRGLLQERYQITDYIQTDAAINPGNSGGPLVNIRGEVIGINSAIASQTGFNAGYGFAIPITLARLVMNELIEHGRVRPPILGISINDAREEDARAAGLNEIRGVKVEGFSGSSSPSEVAGLQPGDVIISAAGQQVDRVSTLQRIVRSHKPGDVLPIEAMRFGRKMTFRVRLAELEAPPVTASAARPTQRQAPAPVTYDRLGISAEDLTTERRTGGAQADLRGVVVTSVAATGPAYTRLAPRDVIVEILNPGGRRPVQGVADLERAIARMRAGEYLTVMVRLAATNYAETQVVSIRLQ